MRVLVQRYSALGDLLILLPLLGSLRKQFPGAEIMLVSKSMVKDLALAEGLRFKAADLKGKHKGLAGLRRLAREIEHDFKPEIIIDAHYVLRSRVVNLFFKLRGRPVFHLEKDRAARKAFLAGSSEGRFLKPVVQLHAENFQRAGFLNFAIPAQVCFEGAFGPEIKSWVKEVLGKKNLGLAPFARHFTKTFPRDKMIDLLQGLDPEVKLFFFGGPDEQEELEAMGQASKRDYAVVAGKFALQEELYLASQMQAFLSMDSSNMHLAAWSGTKVFSIWGGTHPQAGFASLGSDDDSYFQVEELDCRPCSIFGRGDCPRGDFACMQGLDSLLMANKINAYLAHSEGVQQG